MAERGFATGKHAQKITVEYDRYEQDMREMYKALGIPVKGPWRSHKSVDANLVVNLAREHNTNTNIATICGISVDNLMNNFSNEIAFGRALGEFYLSRNQYESIKDRNPSMMQWIGRHWLKQNVDNNDGDNTHKAEVREFVKILRGEVTEEIPSE